MRHVVDGRQAAISPVLRTANTAPIVANILVIPPDLIARASAVGLALDEHTASVAVKHLGAGASEATTGAALVSTLKQLLGCYLDLERVR